MNKWNIITVVVAVCFIILGFKIISNIKIISVPSASPVPVTTSIPTPGLIFSTSGNLVPDRVSHCVYEGVPC